MEWIVEPQSEDTLAANLGRNCCSEMSCHSQVDICDDEEETA